MLPTGAQPANAVGIDILSIEMTGRILFFSKKDFRRVVESRSSHSRRREGSQAVVSATRHRLQSERAILPVPSRQRDEEKRRRKEEKSSAKRLAQYDRERRERDREDQELKRRKSFNAGAPAGYGRLATIDKYGGSAASDLTNRFGDMGIDGRGDPYERERKISSSYGPTGRDQDRRRSTYGPPSECVPYSSRGLHTQNHLRIHLPTHTPARPQVRTRPTCDREILEALDTHLPATQANHSLGHLPHTPAQPLLTLARPLLMQPAGAVGVVGC
jgi:hypothetical protein